MTKVSNAFAHPFYCTPFFSVSSSLILACFFFGCCSSNEQMNCSLTSPSSSNHHHHQHSFIWSHLFRAITDQANNPFARTSDHYSSENLLLPFIDADSHFVAAPHLGTPKFRKTTIRLLEWPETSLSTTQRSIRIRVCTRTRERDRVGLSQFTSLFSIEWRVIMGERLPHMDRRRLPEHFSRLTLAKQKDDMFAIHMFHICNEYIWIQYSHK